MKARISLIITFVVFSHNPVLAQPTPKPTEISAPSKSIKVTHPISDLTKNVETFDKSLTGMVFTVAKVVFGLVSILVLYRLLLLIVYRSSQLVVDNFSNASGAEELNNVLTGLSQLARERLVQEMKGVHSRVKAHIESTGPATYHAPNKLQLPRTTPEQRLSEFLASLSEFTPDQIDPFVNILKVVFPPYGTRVTSILQSQGTYHNKLGITFEITDIEGRIASKLYTIWELDEHILPDGNKDWSPLQLKERYRKLLRSATRWLATELSRREMIGTIPWMYFGNKQRNHYQGQINNFFGVYNSTSASTHGKFFYQLAVEDLLEAIDLSPDWYQPYENLGDTYSAQGREVQAEGLKLERQAILQYEKALSLCQDDFIKRRIRVGKATAALLTGDKIMIQEAKQEISTIESWWNEASELNFRFLYNLASWYALTLSVFSSDIAHRQIYGVANALPKARRYLVYALTRDRDRTLWYWASKDPDLENIREGFADLEFFLLKKLNEIPELATLRGDQFAKPIEQVLKAINWL